jgi:hypothetical protein
MSQGARSSQSGLVDLAEFIKRSAKSFKSAQEEM